MKRKRDDENVEEPEVSEQPNLQLAVIDRFEGDVAVLSIGDGEEEEPLDVPRTSLPKGAKAGDHLRVEVENGQLISAEIDEAETADTKLRIEDKLARLRRGDHLKE